MDNPFEHIFAQLTALSLKIDSLIEAHRSPRPEWETLQNAMRTRRVGRRAVLDAVDKGQVRCTRVPAPGGRDAYRLSCSDLDRLFPLRTKK